MGITEEQLNRVKNLEELTPADKKAMLVKLIQTSY